MNRLSNKTSLVTGGGSGIGREVCLRLASEGSDVIILDLDLEQANQTAKEVELLGVQATAAACDVANSHEVSEVLSAVLHIREVNILVNNAGIAHIGNIENTSEEDLDLLYKVNVKGFYNIMASIVPHMKENNGGSIINLASIASVVGIADRFAYSMTKGAVLTMTQSVAKDYISHGIRCNCVSPARIHTPFVDGFLQKNYPDNVDEMFEKLSKSQPIGRMGQADEVAALVAYLASDESAFVTGNNFPIDGGFIKLNN